MLKAAYPAIKSADPTSVVLGGALAQNDDQFLQRVYADGGGPYFDAVSTHSYPTGDPNNCWDDSPGHRDPNAFCSIENIRNTMVANGDSGKPIWLDEFGWSTCSNAYADCYGVGVSESQQASYITSAFQKLETYPWVKAAFVYNFRNNYYSSESPGSWGDNTGLLRKDFSEKPAFAAFSAYAHGEAPAGGGADSGVAAQADQPAAAPAVELVFSVASGGRRAAGVVRGANTGQVVIRVQRHSGSRWAGASRRRVQVRGDGTFSAALGRGLSQGRYRAIADYVGHTDHQSPLRSIRYFTAR
jgi:hypothetical protein